MWSAEWRQTRLLLVAVATALLFLPAALFGDALGVVPNDSPNWRGPWYAVVTGRTSTGSCESVKIGESGRMLATLPFNFVSTSAEDPCRTRVIAFARGARPQVVESPPFTPDAQDAFFVRVGGSELLQVRLWVLTCRAERGEPCTGAPGEVNYVASDAREDYFNALWVLNENMAGIMIGGMGPDDLHASADSRSLDQMIADFSKSEERDPCGAIATRLTATKMFQPGMLNAYYTSLPAEQADLFCKPIAQSENEVRRSGFIIMAAAAELDVLAHEIGHALRLSHPLDGQKGASPELRNLMRPGARLNRCNFDLDQVYRIHAVQDFARYRMPALGPPAAPLLLDPLLLDPHEPGCFGIAGTPCHPNLTRQRSNFDCPQSTRKIVLDWIRCLHCPESMPPISIGDDGPNLVFALRAIAGGYVRVEDRQKMAKAAEDLADKLIGAFLPSLERQRLVDFYFDDMLMAVRLRAIDALAGVDGSQSGDPQMVCASKALAIEALAWVAGEPDENTRPRRPLPESLQKTAESHLEELRESKCPLPVPAK